MGIYFIQLVEISKNKFVLRQVVISPLRSFLVKNVFTRLFIVICKIGVRHINHFF
mgnify:CR=1 FL=1